MLKQNELILIIKTITKNACFEKSSFGIIGDFNDGKINCCIIKSK